MTDKELLTLAARAAGIKWPQNLTSAQIQIEGMRMWNPLTDPADALRLVVQLKIDLLYFTEFVRADFYAAYEQMESVYEKYGTDPLAATMRAITRAAAEIGRRMPE